MDVSDSTCAFKAVGSNESCEVPCLSQLINIIYILSICTESVDPVLIELIAVEAVADEP